MAEPTTNSLFGNVSNFRKIASVLVLLVVAGVLYAVQTKKVITFEITSDSMEPTLKVGDKFVMIEPSQYHIGDVVVMSKPDGSASYFVKRLVAGSGDRVALINGLLYVNGVPSPPPGLPDTPVESLPDRSWAVPEDHIFVVGDNRSDSYDSRDFGPVPEALLRGRLRIRL